jgi:hypothetical protein
MNPSGVVHDRRGVDPIAYIRAVGLRPEDSYGFLPLDLHDSASYLFLYRDRPEYAQPRAALPEAGSVRNINLGLVEFDVGSPRQIGVEVAPQAAGMYGDAVAQALAMQQAWIGGAGVPAAAVEPTGARLEQLKGLREKGLLDDEEYRAAVARVQGVPAEPAAGAAGEPGAAPAAESPADVPPIVVDRVYPRLFKRSSSDQLNAFMPEYRDALHLCPEDVYGVFPRQTRTTSSGSGGGNSEVWDDYWIIYRERPEYAAGRAAWAAQMNVKEGLAERMFGSFVDGGDTWPAAQLIPGVAAPGATTFDSARVAVEREGWPREKLVMRKKGTELGDALSAKIGGWGYAPEDSFGFCPDFNSNTIFFAWRSR